MKKFLIIARKFNIRLLSFDADESVDFRLDIAKENIQMVHGVIYDVEYKRVYWTNYGCSLDTQTTQLKGCTQSGSIISIFINGTGQNYMWRDQIWLFHLISIQGMDGLFQGVFREKFPRALRKIFRVFCRGVCWNCSFSQGARRPNIIWLFPYISLLFSHKNIRIICEEIRLCRIFCHFACRYILTVPQWNLFLANLGNFSRNIWILTKLCK